MLKVYTDGGARGNPGPAASAFVVTKNGSVLAEGAKYLGKKTNNYAEYQALLMAFEWLCQNKKKLKDEEKVEIFLDSELIVKQMTGVYKIKSTSLRPIAIEIKAKQRSLPVPIFYTHVKRDKNTHADRLVNEELDKNNS